MHIHILGICGTFMGSLALLARELGYRVTGSDAGVYPPMSTQLEAQGIALMEGYGPDNLEPAPDLVVIGNALSRGNPEVEAVLNRHLPYTSGPQWLQEHVLGGRPVLAVAGTHGKTTTASILAWLLEYAGQSPGFLIGGVPRNFGISARLGNTKAPFVIEADEYDTAFFDKRSKFVHYRPDVAVLNNLEFDHADIFDDLAAIERQFHHLVRTVPGEGALVINADEPALKRVLERGCWTPVIRFGDSADVSIGDWQVQHEPGETCRFTLHHGQHASHTTEWALSGGHNLVNALAAAAAAATQGVSVEQAGRALAEFASPRRRQELRGVVDGIEVIDDFAHHPTAIASTLSGLRSTQRAGRLLAVIEPRSNTMRLGTMKARLPESVSAADQVYWYQPATLNWSVDEVSRACRVDSRVFHSIEALINALVEEARPNDRIVVMSNGSFEGLHERLLEALTQRMRVSLT
ncbi:UDP-N-acetylmuramate:L-alanyl-gamma-D-glutamyl-meso-diaminopimelate ligase [Kushneria phosphatilytica]|uniref:UDP-N-acetylmuramate--L-alanyl-gamma-D-glutamyl-meso-2,6-diaminoheptandioate ligase n=1 Tax=Kushneria phosphatilytica TaxID=657387 RepID=A0A1S1P0T2_9GAMM|nr:UDP-N-acetylmuramate:L-alanyl-gamma-D-glutamyl-meso-diaminopimelate ligase [Kushneria phosphatilytica]OHV13038.1 UDP-N-acetylmuramate:L-alanyl-gamma-D-glutamyl-meso-diaminopimelate ligase [Kushneria phosphatilytica]QEL10911.1 UDP-N-acetylmuramate:L-alanyl-gamma-D-glutamyl-meso-diaminopimelate ligase [Kushneria phosphatilytica]